MRHQSEAPIELTEYQPEWPARFEAERARLEALLAPWLCGAIEHIGSTAVPGLVAKPVIDMLAPVQSLEGSRAAIEPLAAFGYVHHPYRPDVMHWFCKPSAAFRTHHLHLVPFGSAVFRERLTFRDALRDDSALAAEYAALKTRLAARHRDDREAYTDAKWPFIEGVLARLLRRQRVPRQDGKMLALFEVHVAEATDIEQLLSDSVRAETGAQIMTVSQAKAVGFGGLDSLEEAGNVYLVAVAIKDARFISTRLESSAMVRKYRMHEVEG